jgi:putative permease
VHDRDPRARDGTTPDRAGAPLPAGPRRVPRPGPGERRSRDVFVRRMAIVGAAAAVGWALYLARHALRLAYAAMLVSVALSPLVAWLERRALPSVLRHRPPRAVAILLLVVTVLGCIGGLGFLILSPLVAQAHDLVGALPGLVDQAQAFAARHGLLQHPVSITQVVANAPTAKIVGATTATAGHVLVIAGELFALLFLTFYVLVEAPDLFRRGMELVPEAHRAEARRACRVITEKVSAWLTGHVLLGLIVGGTAAAALALLGIPYFFVFGAISFLGEFLP